MISITNELFENINMGQNNYQILKITNLFLILLRNYHKNIQRENKNVKKNKFFVFNYTMTHINENQIWLKLIKNLYIFKLFNFYIKELKLKKIIINI